MSTRTGIDLLDDMLPAGSSERNINGDPTERGYQSAPGNTGANIRAVGGSFSPRVISFDQHTAELQTKEQEFNQYATSKSMSQLALNTSTIQGQIYIFVLLLSSPVLNGFQIALAILMPGALLLQLVLFVLLTILAKATTEQIGTKCTATCINNVVTTFSGLLVIVTAACNILSFKAGVGEVHVTAVPNGSI